MIKFMDTNMLIHGDYEDGIYISSVTLEELEQIKTNKNKTEELRYRARRATRWLEEHDGQYEVIVYDDIIRHTLLSYTSIDDSPDNKICACAAYLRNSGDDQVYFYTRDLSCKHIAKGIFGLCVADKVDEVVDEYSGYKIIHPTDDELAYLYENMNVNIYDLLINQYLIIYDKDGNCIDTLRWTGDTHVPIFKKAVKSLYFEKLRSKDVYQSCVIDSLVNNTITAISGKAGSGKSLLSLMVAMWLIEIGKYERLVVMFNPTKTRGASDLGYYSGDFLEKAMQNSIGQILTTKFGDRYAIDVLMQQNKLKLVSMADARGMEITDSEILWITEAQNTSVDLIKLCLSRVSSGSKVFIEGDYASQVDSHSFEGDNNGLKRVINAFKGHEEFGFVRLQNVWRSKIAELCELL